jgi:hypothetical protein
MVTFIKFDLDSLFGSSSSQILHGCSDGALVVVGVAASGIGEMAHTYSQQGTISFTFASSKI